MGEYEGSSGKLLIFAKAPVPGQVKTRMQPELTPEQSVSLHRLLLRHTLDTCLDALVAPVELWVAGEHPWWAELGFTLEVCQQQGNDLGERMYNAAISCLSGHQPVVIIGGDCPFIGGDYLRRAFAALIAGDDVVLGPAVDGGYVLIGLNKVSRELFNGVHWGEASVLADTRQRLQTLGWRYSELEPLADIDRPEDLQLLDTYPALRRW